VGNYALAASIVISIPIICKVRYSIIFTVMMYIFGLGSLGCNIAFIILVLIKSGKHFGDCYMRQNLQYFMVALSGLEIFLIADVLCYILVIRRRIQHTRMFDQLARPVR
jgi:glycerol-3-phosphate acyltransferase PlsY